MEEALRTGALAAVTASGTPVAQPATVSRIVDVGWRRWSSYERRVRSNRTSTAMRVEDLAKGLRDMLEPDPSMVGPLMEDYRDGSAHSAAEACV